MKRILIILAVIMLAAVPATAQIPRLINYQGVLTDDMGAVVSDGPYNMTFRLYDVPSGGSNLWEETIAVNVSKGIFNTTLGHDVVIEEVFDKPLYLSIEIDGGGELSPRRLFTASAYAFSTRALYGISNIFPSTGYVGIGITAPEAPLHIYADISSSAEPALLIQNVGGQSVIDFKMATVTEARIRKAGGGDLFLGTLTGQGITFRLAGSYLHRMLPDGSFGIDNLSPVEKLDVGGAIRLGTTANTNAGTIRWTGADFEGYDGSLWNSLTTGGGSGLPAGTSGQTLRHDGADWTATTNLYNNGTSIGIGTVSPTSPLHVVYSAGQVALQADSDDGSWASIYVNATNASGSPNYGYQRQHVTVGHHYLDSSLNWNLELDNNPALIVQPNGWASFGSVAVYESLNIPGALKLGNNANNNAGTIRWTGADFEGYNGSSWNSFTGSALPAGITGQTLRFDGAAWVSSTNLTNTGTSVGIGTSSPGAKLHIYGTGIEETRVESTAPTGYATVNILTSGGTNDYLRLVKYGPSRSGAIAGDIPIANLSMIGAGSDAGALMLHTAVAEPIHFVTSNIERFRITSLGHFEGYYNEGTMFSSLYGNASGGINYLYDDEGNSFYSVQPDVSPGGGGYMYLRRNNGFTGFHVDGNYLGTEGTRVSVFGPTATISLNASTTGNASVVLPTDAISSTEILDEPGTASATANTSTVIGTTASVLLFRNITVPDDGYVFVIGTTQAQIGHGTGTSSTLNVGVSDSPTVLPDNQDVGWLIPANSATATYTLPITVQGLFEVSAGDNSFYLLGRSATASASMYGLDKQLTLIYIPTNYGTVSPTLVSSSLADSDVPTDRGMSTGDMSAERAASIDANNARIDKELADMRAQIEALQAELENSNQ